MRADNSHHLIAAARNRAEQTRTRAHRALRRLDQAGTAITFEAVAREAGVSRSWLYGQVDLRDQIQALRARHQPAPSTPRTPQRQAASETSSYVVSMSRTNGCVSSKQTTTNCVRPSPKLSAQTAPHESQARTHAATRPGDTTQNSSNHADNNQPADASTTPSTTQTP
jgi:Family of unknown function (DUF6262)